MNKQTAHLLEQHFDTAFSAPNGIQKLRELILTLAMQGRLVPQEPKDAPASQLLKEIDAEKKRLVKGGKIKAPKLLPEIKPEEIPYAVPQGWEWVRLNDALDIRDGTHDTPKYVDVGYPLVTSKNIYTGQLCFDDVKYISEEDHKKISERSKVDAGDILFAMIGSIGNPVIVEIKNEFSIKNMALFKFHITDKPNRRYLHYFLTRAQENMKLISSGAVQSFVSLGFLRAYLMPLPPLPEQHRIVAKIDQLMARCDALENLRNEREEKRLSTHAAALSQLLDTTGNGSSDGTWAFITRHFGELYAVKENVSELRKAILQLAVMGKLVPQDPNDPPASELLKDIEAEKKRLVKEGKIKAPKLLSEIKPEEVPYALPNGWAWVRTWSVAQLITSGSRGWAAYLSDSGAIFVTMGNLSRGSYQLRMNNIRYVNPPDRGEGSRTKLEENDLLISITGDVGNLGLIPPNFGDAYINQHTCLLRFMPLCRTRYFPELMRSPLAKLQFDGPQRGIKNSFRLGDVGEMLIPLPPLAEQHRIVVRIDQLMSLCDTLEHRIAAATRKQTELLNAVMAQV